MDEEFYTVRGYQLLNKDERLLTSAMEDYLEMIYRNISAEGYMRINTLSQLLNVRPSSATKMVQKLTSLGFLKYEKYGIVLLTERGYEKGEYLLKRHNTVEKFLETIGVKDNILLQTELIEHNIARNTLDNISLLVEFLEENPETKGRFDAYKTKKVKKDNEDGT